MLSLTNIASSKFTSPLVERSTRVFCVAGEGITLIPNPSPTSGRREEHILTSPLVERSTRVFCVAGEGITLIPNPSPTSGRREEHILTSPACGRGRHALFAWRVREFYRVIPDLQAFRFVLGYHLTQGCNEIVCRLQRKIVLSREWRFLLGFLNNRQQILDR